VEEEALLAQSVPNLKSEKFQRLLKNLRNLTAIPNNANTHHIIKQLQVRDGFAKVFLSSARWFHQGSLKSRRLAAPGKSSNQPTTKEVLGPLG
jgi:hypothetical protein